MPETTLIVDVIEAIAQADNREPSAVEFTLAEYIDPALLGHLDEMEDGVWEFTFRVSDHQVRLTHDGAIFVDGRKHEADKKKQNDSC